MDTKYSRMGLILALIKLMWYLTGRNSFMQAITATCFKEFFLRLAKWDDQDREGSISSPNKLLVREC